MTKSKLGQFYVTKIDLKLPILVYGKVALIEAIKNKLAHLLEGIKGEDAVIAKGTIIQVIEDTSPLSTNSHIYTMYSAERNLSFMALILPEEMELLGDTYPYASNMWEKLNEDV